MVIDQNSGQGPAQAHAQALPLLAPKATRAEHVSAQPGTAYNHYLGSLVTLLDRVARIPQLIAESTKSLFGYQTAPKSSSSSGTKARVFSKKPTWLKKLELASPVALKVASYTALALMVCFMVFLLLVAHSLPNFVTLIPWHAQTKSYHNKAVPAALLRPPIDGSEAFPLYASPEGGSGCEPYVGEDRKFCEGHVGKEAEENFEVYRAALASCEEWTTEDPHEDPRFVYMHLQNEELSSSSVNAHHGYDYAQKKIDEYRHKLTLRTCETTEDDTHSWTFAKLGPFHSTGGYDWHRHLTPDIGHFSSKGAAYVTGFMATAVDVSGNVLGMPPIHIHHTHAATNQCWYLRALFNGEHVDISSRDRHDPEAEVNDWEFDVHGDRQCLTNNGGTACLLEILPDGYGQFIKYPMCSLGDWNDMRPAGSPELEFWILNAFRWTQKPQKQVGFMTAAIGPGYHPSYSIISQMTSKMKHNGRKKVEEPSFFEDYLVPQDDSILWGSFAPTYSGRFVSMYFHTHHLWTKDMLFFRGDPKALGLNKPPFVLEQPYTPRPLKEIGLTMDEIKRSIYNNLNKHSNCNAGTCPDLVCQMNQDRFESNESLPLGLMGGVLSNKYERIAYPKCTMTDFHEGDVFTLISFHGTVEGAPPPVVGKSRMHSVVYAKVAPIPPATTIKASAHFWPREVAVPLFKSPNTAVSETSALLMQLFQKGLHTMV